MKKQIEVQGEQYEFVFSDRRIDIIEQTTGKPIIRNFYENQGMIALADLRVMFVQSLKKVDGPYIQPKMGEEAFRQVIGDIGYAALSALIVEALQEDCPFFFLEG